MAVIVCDCVYNADDFVATSGVACGDPLGLPADLVPDDGYTLAPNARAFGMELTGDGTDTLRTGDCNGSVPAGASVRQHGRLIFMTGHTAVMTAMVLSVQSVTERGRILFAASRPIEPGQDWRLVDIDTGVRCASHMPAPRPAFATGTRIVLANGRHRPVERLQPGDLVLTRDSGARSLRDVCRHDNDTRQDIAAVRIRAGTLNNPRDLNVHPSCGIIAGAQSADACDVRAAHMVDGTSVTTVGCGNTAYYTLYFAAPETIYAEGIATRVNAGFGAT